MLKSGEVVNPRTGASADFSLIQDRDGDFLVELVLAMDSEDPDFDARIKPLLKQLPSKLVPAVEAGRVIPREIAPNKSSIGDFGLSFPKAEFQRDAGRYLSEQGFELHQVKLYRVPLAEGYHTIAMLYVDFPDSEASTLHRVRRVLEERFGILVRFQRDYIPDYRTRLAILEAEKSGTLIRPNELEELVERASSGDLEAFAIIQIGGSMVRDGEAVYEDHRERALCSIDPPGTNRAEDLLFGAFYRDKELGEMVYTDVLLEDKRYGNRGFRQGVDTRAFSLSWFRDKEGNIHHPSLSLALANSRGRFTPEQLNTRTKELAVSPEIRRSIDALTLSVIYSRLAESQVGAPVVRIGVESRGGIIVQDHMRTANRLFPREFIDTDIPIICRVRRPMEREFLSEVQKVLPEVTEADLSGIRLGTMLSNLFQLGECDLFYEILDSVAGSSHYEAIRPDSSLPKTATARLKNGLDGWINQVHAGHLLSERKIACYSDEELQRACAILNHHVSHRMERNASLIAKHARNGNVDRVGAEADGIVRFHRRREREVFVDVRQLGLTGIALLHGSVEGYADLARGDLVRVRYLGYQPHLQQNLFEFVESDGSTHPLSAGIAV